MISHYRIAAGLAEGLPQNQIDEILSSHCWVGRTELRKATLIGYTNDPVSFLEANGLEVFRWVNISCEE